MGQTEVALRPSYWASVSGGKDSLMMLMLILQHLDEYPLDGVVHYELIGFTTFDGKPKYTTEYVMNRVDRLIPLKELEEWK